MEKSNFDDSAMVPTIPVMPRTLIIRPMEYKHPNGTPVFFSGVFGNDMDSKEAGDIWVATFYDRNEAEMFVMTSKSFGRPVDGVRLQLQVVKSETGNTGTNAPEAAG